MSRFTTHAIKRFVERYINRLPHHPQGLEQELKRFRYWVRDPSYTWQGDQFGRIGSLAGDNYNNSLLVSREEAEALINGRLIPRPNRYYRSAGASLGLWIVCWEKQRKEKVLTYLAPGDTPNADDSTAHI